VRLIGALLLPPVVITCLLASKVLGLFGADYAKYSTLLVLLLVATVPNTLTDLAMASLRVQRRLIPVAAITVTGSAITIGGAWLLWLLMPQWGITGAGVSALASAVVIATTLAVLLFYRYRVGARTAGTAGDPNASVDGEPPVVVAPLADASLLSPVVTFAPPADDSPSEIEDRSGRA
jgi:O-antigen/teichoic acid export membrane protein